MSRIFNYLFIILFLPTLLFSNNISTTPIKLLSKENNNSKSNEVLNNEDNIQEVENQIDIQKKLIEDVVDKLNSEIYLVTLPDKNFYDNEILFLTNRININKLQGNSLAVKRDELRVALLEEKASYEKTLKDIIIAKKEFKNKQYFEDLLRTNIQLIQDFKLDEFTSTYENEANNSNKISTEFTNNYIELYNQKHTQLFVLQYLNSNLQAFRSSNFLIDEFNLKYLINKIDDLKGVSFISSLTSYHFNFSVGEVAVVLFIILFFRLISRYLLTIILNIISKVFIKKDDSTSDDESFLFNLKEAINKPLFYALYLLAIQISILILVKDQILINQIMPWINTIYMALLTWAIYSVLDISISIYAQNLLEKYQNVRKEMIVFILKIIKVLLILVVVLFLFTQLGMDIKAIAASLGVGGIAVALAAKDTLANFFASLNIMTDNSFSQGDWIKTSAFEGTVVDIRMRTTRIRTFDNAMITVPNSQIANAHILNWSKRIIGRRIKMSLGITYESKMQDIMQLKDDIYQMLHDHPQIATNHNIHISRSRAFEAIKKEDLDGIKNTLLVFVDEFGPSSINILIYCFSRSPDWEDWLTTKQDVMVKISDLVQKNNCDFAYPTQAIVLKKEQELDKLEELNL